MAKRPKTMSAAAGDGPAPVRSARAWPTVRGAAEGPRTGCEDYAAQGAHTLSALITANAALSEALERMGLELVG